ncbi:hypothetical protein FG877_02170 [Enterococcus casseliflavus]|nr:hypothetical protein [Enterococcus casseliflavus]
MKRIYLLGVSLLSVTILGGCGSNDTTASISESSSIVESSTKISSSSTVESTSSSETSSSSTLISSTEETSSSVDTETLNVENNADETVSFDDATKTLTTPISKIKLEGQEFNYIKRGAASEPVFLIKYSVQNISDEVFNMANKGSNDYIKVTYERESKQFIDLGISILSDENDPSHVEFENKDKRLEQGETLTLADAYRIPKNVKTIYVEFKDTRYNAIKRLQVDIPENVQQEIINYVP